MLSASRETWADLRERQRAERVMFLEAALRATRGNRTDAAGALGLQRSYLLRLIREHGINVPPNHDQQRIERLRATWDRKRAAVSPARSAASGASAR